MEKLFTCPDCHGAGSTPAVYDEPEKCGTCDGTGKLTRLDLAVIELEQSGFLVRTAAGMWHVGPFDSRDKRAAVWSLLKDNPKFELRAEMESREAKELKALNSALRAIGRQPMAEHPNAARRKEEAYRKLMNSCQ